MLFSGDCQRVLSDDLIPCQVDLTFLDPPFNQAKDYAYFSDNLSHDEYWRFMLGVCTQAFRLSNPGGAVYFMQREKNTEFVLACLRESGWTLQNLIIWKKKTSAVPVAGKYGKHYQVIAYATKGNKAKTFNRLRINPPLPPNFKHERDNGVYVTDVWDDIRELTSGYYAGNEAIRDKQGERLHKQQSPIALLLRIILASTKEHDWVLDPFAGTGTTLCVAKQLNRNSIGIEIDPFNVSLIRKRLKQITESDSILKYRAEYECTDGLDEILGVNGLSARQHDKTLSLFNCAKR